MRCQVSQYLESHISPVKTSADTRLLSCYYFVRERDFFNLTFTEVCIVCFFLLFHWITEEDVEQPSSPSVKKTEEEGIIVVHEVNCKVYVKVMNFLLENS